MHPADGQYGVDAGNGSFTGVVGMVQVRGGQQIGQFEQFVADFNHCKTYVLQSNAIFQRFSHDKWHPLQCCQTNSSCKAIQSNLDDKLDMKKRKHRIGNHEARWRTEQGREFVREKVVASSKSQVSSHMVTSILFCHIHTCLIFTYMKEYARDWSRISVADVLYP